MKNCSPPLPEKILKELIAHGQKRVDNYFWLNDRDNPKVIEYLKAENDYTDAVMAHTHSLQAQLYDEMKGRIKQEDESVPYEDNGYFYYARFEEGKEYPLFCRKKGSLENNEEVMLDVNKMAKSHDIYKVVGTFISPDNATLAFIVDTSGDRRCTVYFRDLSSGKILDDVLANASERLAWVNDSTTVFYCINDETIRSYKILKHTLGTPSDKDQLIFHETDKTYSTYVTKSKSKKLIFIKSESTTSSETRFADADSLHHGFQLLHSREPDVLYDAEYGGDRFFIRTNWHARNFKLVEAPLYNPSKEAWKDVIPHREGVLLEGFEVFEDYLVLQERKEGLPQFRIMDRKEESEHYITFPEETYFAFIGENRIFNTDTFRFYYTSLTTPLSTFDHNMKTKEKKLMKETEVKWYNRKNYEIRRLFAETSDGTKIPISMVYKKGMRNGTSPLLLYAYGSYGASANPFFAPEILSLLDRGFIYAIAHVRGGQEMGRHWYEEGKMLKKKNTFTDFISCAEYLVERKYTNPQKLFVNGRSAGGLLIGVAVNMRPELFCGIIAEVPWVDVVTDMLDDSIPLTTLEYEEWGNPHKKEYYDYMLSYSPYDNVKARKYPTILATGGLNDSQVTYWNPAKWVAKLREMKTDENIILLKINMGAGHDGASGRFEKYKLCALKYAFMLDLLGMGE